MQGHTWLWLRRHIVALLTAPPQVVVAGERVHLIPQTRLGLRLQPPDFNARPPAATPAARPEE